VSMPSKTKEAECLAGPSCLPLDIVPKRARNQY
jgi:hypothetical protein